MPIDDNIKIAKESVSLIGEVIKAAGDNPNVQAAGNELGKAALIVTRTINNALLPLAAVNFAFDKAREYFEKNFENDLAEKTASLLPDQIVEPKASIAGPALQGLAFSNDEPDLKNMYLSLLASAMDKRITDNAHPAFVEIIRQLNSEEAQLLRQMLCVSTGVPIVEIRSNNTSTGAWIVLLRNLLNFHDPETHELKENPRLPAMVNNWCRLGLVEVDFTKYLADINSYSWVEQRPEFIRFRARETEVQKVIIQKGTIERTALGEQFATVVGLIPQSK